MNEALYTRIEAIPSLNSLVFIEKGRAQILLLNLTNLEKANFAIESSESRVIKDIDTSKRHLFILYDKNEVAVFDVISKQRVFKAVYRDAT